MAWDMNSWEMAKDEREEQAERALSFRRSRRKELTERIKNEATKRLGKLDANMADVSAKSV